jgi:hypothetical protein
MKYLRLFEGFGGDYYEEIGREDFLKLSLHRAKSWKCDQWDGLVRLLVDEGIITQDK